MAMVAQPRPDREDEPDEPDELWSLEDWAEAWDVTIKTCRKLIAEGRVPAYRLAGKRLIRVRKSDVMALLEPIPAAGNGAA